MREAATTRDRRISSDGGWALSKPISVAIVGVHRLTDLDENTAIARDFKPLSSSELRLRYPVPFEDGKRPQTSSRRRSGAETTVH
jgi:hypothetical protein